MKQFYILALIRNEFLRIATNTPFFCVNSCSFVADSKNREDSEKEFKMNNQQLFKTTAQFTGLLLLVLLILNLVPARLAGAAVGDFHVPLNSLLPSGCETNVAETSQFSMVYQLSIPTNVNYNGAVPAYSVDNSGSIGAFNRVGYCLELDSNWVWVSMDAFTTVPTQLGVPVASTGAVFQQTINNMNVASNVPGVVTGTGITTGNIEFWHHCYSQGAFLGLPGANSSTYDFDDTYVTASCYGSMQVHNYGATQTIFGWNRWDETGGVGDLGIGNSPTGNPDWTFRNNANSYTTRLLTVYAQASLIVTTANDVVDANGGSCAGMTLASLPGPDGLLSLREAICAANVNAGADTITFDSSLNGTPITLSIAGRGENSNVTGDLDITDDLTIQGNGARSTIVDGADIDRVMDVHANTTVNINDVTIQNGDANQTGNDGSPGTTGEDGGGIRASSGSIALTINDSRITSNHAYDDGGAVSANTASTTIVINRSLIDHNSAQGSATDNGGGLNAWPAGNIIVNNTTISNNSSGNGGNGGAAFAQGGVITLNNTTVTGNSDVVGGNAGLTAASGGTFNLTNTIVSGNSPNDCNSFGGIGTITSNGYNVVGSGGSANGCPAGGTGDQVLAGAVSTLLNTTLANNGGTTDTHALVAGGIAVDPSPDTTVCGTTLTDDQRGVARPQNSTCDIGAFELVTAVTPGTAGGLGPGGVGHTDGNTPLELWLRADRGVYANTGCTTVAANSNDVACWQDQSGNGHHFTMPTVSNQPNYFTGIENNQPVIRFYGDGDPDFLNSTPVLTAGDDTFTYFANWMGTQTNVDHVIFEQNHTSAVTGRRAALIAIPSAHYGFNGLNNDFHNAAPYVANQYEVSSIVLNGNPSNNVLVYDSGRQYVGTINIGTQDVGVGGSTVGHYTFAAGYDMRGDIPEVIVFSDALNDTDRILVENYLSAKYNIAQDTANGAVDVYDGDTPGNGDFDLDVAGIGRFGGNNHTQAHAAGMIVVNGNFLQDDGDWLLFGHNVAANANSTADLPTTGDWAAAPNPQRWLRHFYIDVTDDTTTVDCSTPGTCFVDIIFDYSEGEMDGNPLSMPGGYVSNYRLLKRSGVSGTFTDIATATAIVDDQVHFQGVDVSLLGSNFTLGSLDDAESPTAVTLTTALSRQASTPVAAALTILLLVSITLLLWYKQMNQKQTMDSQ